MTGGRVLDDVDCGASPELLVEVPRGLKVLVELELMLEPADTEVAVVDVVPVCRVVVPEEADCDADPVLPPVVIDTGMLEVPLVPEAEVDVPDALKVLLPAEETPAKLVELLENDAEDDTMEELPDVVSDPVELAKDDGEDEDIDEDDDEAEDEDKDEAADENVEDDVDEDSDKADEDDDDEDNEDEDNEEEYDDEVRKDEVVLVDDGHDAAGGGNPYTV